MPGLENNDSTATTKTSVHSNNGDNTRGNAVSFRDHIVCSKARKELTSALNRSQSLKLNGERNRGRLAMTTLDKSRQIDLARFVSTNCVLGSGDDHVPDCSVDILVQEIERLRSDLEESNREKIKAAEYGLLVLEEKVQLQQDLEELDVEHEALKQELDTALQRMDELQLGVKKQESNECLMREQLAEESSDRERSLLETTETLRIELTQTQQNLRLEKESREYLEGELEKKERNESLLRQQCSALQLRDAEQDRRCVQLERMNKDLHDRLARLAELQDEVIELQCLNARLVEEKEAVLDKVRGIVEEKRASERQIASTVAALEKEHQAKIDLEQELEEVRESVCSSHLSSRSELLEVEGESSFFHSSPERHPLVKSDSFSESSSAMCRTVSSANLARDISLMNELKLNVNDEAAKRLEDLESSLAEAYEREQEAEAKAAALRKEIEQLKLSHGVATSQSATIVSQQLAELQATHVRVCDELAKEHYTRNKLELDLEEREKVLGSECSRLKAELAAIEVKLEGLRTASNDQAEASRLQVARLEEEVSLLRNQEQDALREQAVATEQLQDSDRMAGQHADELAHVKSELEALRTDLEKLTRVVMSMSSSEAVTATTSNSSIGDDSSGDIELTAAQLLGIVREQIRVVRAAVEVMVRRSLEKVVAAAGSGDTTVNLSDEEKKEFQLQVQQLQVQLAAKRQEVSTLRTVLKAHRSTAQAAVFRERSFAERQLRAADTETEGLRQRIAKLRQDNTDFAQMRASFAKRCDGYIEQLAQQQKLQQQHEEEMLTLNKMIAQLIQQKVELTQRLEDLEWEKEIQRNDAKAVTPKVVKKPTQIVKPSQNMVVFAESTTSAKTLALATSGPSFRRSLRRKR